MLNCINGVYTPSEGSITFRGQTLATMNSRQVAEMGVARTFQNLALFKGMSVIDNLMTGRNLKIAATCSCRRCAWGPASARRRRTASGLQGPSSTSRSRLPQDAGRPAALRPAKTRRPGPALAMEPQVLLLDEPMAGMNLEEKQDMCRFILDVNDEFGTTIVLIEHDMGVVMDISDRSWCSTTARRSATARRKRCATTKT